MTVPKEAVSAKEQEFLQSETKSGSWFLATSIFKGISSESFFLQHSVSIHMNLLKSNLKDFCFISPSEDI